jgi:hypothetical protein
MNQFKFMRACFGVAVSGLFGVAVTFFSKAEPAERQRGLVWGTVEEN